ncbi:type II toxin-antitoxin system CcdA family antitoxin [Duganella aceris]|uniref:Type II toxin-antitoxin system CcdA family antitoxin n=1 Tax=Duganella aceris TaxID=2703883 RepID=A0ABX0FBS6_9BURK|nr:type II toxin-antitoxin system CcdA family antitoxin [Duganella aceris]NGZ82795.1 type II toxin-antitoxin system CcdA family antitoxin [Duganella aceris]
MLKEVGASGQISLGKKYAGKLFDVILHPNDRFELIPVATASPQAPQICQVPDGWVPPGGYDGCTQWSLDNRVALEDYARQIEEEGTAAEQLQRFLAEHPEMLADDHGEI